MNKFISAFIILNMFFLSTYAVFASDKDANWHEGISSDAQTSEVDAEKKESSVSFKIFKKNKNDDIEKEKREAKTFALFKRKEKKTQETDLVKKEETKEQSKSEQKVAKKEKTKKAKKKNSKYDEYLIPIDGYMPVGNSSDKSITISGSVQKTLELNLADCLELSLINNPKIKAAYANAEAMKLEIVDQMESELVMEGLIKAKGFEDAIVTNSANNINVIVKCASLESSQVAQIVAIVQEQTQKSIDNIKIIPVE